MILNKTRLQELIDLGSEPSSARRRELLREVTDLFFISPDDHGPKEMELFDGVLSTLAGEMATEVQAELAGRMADVEHAPRTLVRTLASAPIEVAAPLLTRGRSLSEDDLLQVVSTQGQDHLRAISGRTDLSTSISDVIVDRADDHTLKVLLANDRAPLSRQASEKVVDRAVENPGLHAAVVGRESLPIDLLNEMYFVVESRLRDAISTRNANIDPAELDAALEVGRKRLATRDGALPPDFTSAEAEVAALKKKGGITPKALVSFLRQSKKTQFLVALCDQTEIDFHTARRIVERQDLDALAIVCKAAQYDRALFLTFAVLILDPGEGMGRAEEYGRLYANQPHDTAQRTMRFWKMRRTTGDVAAA